ncbi:MAG: GEVED domain-containing protein, partial [Dokdonella sp.]
KTLTLDSDAPGLGLRCSGSSQLDSLDYDGDGNTAETLCAATGTITVAPIAQLVSNKQAEGVCDASFTMASTTLPGGRLRYRLNVQNVGTVAMSNMVLIDILPTVGDTGVRDTSPRGSQFTPLLVAPIIPPSGTILSYSTSSNPCRGEVGGPTTGCDPPNWSTTEPDPISSVRSFKLEFGARSVAAFDTLSFEFGMVAPASLTAASVAYNSFAYQAYRSDGLGSLAAEPQKVSVMPGICSIAPSLGDFVWRDGNGNGIQDSGENGIDGVPLTLFDAGADGIAGTPDDIAIEQTITQPAPLTAIPGWYRFANLLPGVYRVCAIAPPNLLVTLQDQGGDDALDSDFNASTACTAPVTVNSGDAITSVDLGLVPTAALGNYVWFDRNGDGVQNEGASDGANGVTVRLFADNGNNVAEPAIDALVATTVTTDDASHRPGYYSFSGLSPTQKYFVQFVLPAIATAFTTPNSGSDPALDSDAATVNGSSAVVMLAPDEFNRTIDAGLIVPSGPLVLGDQVWLDGDNDGVFEPQNGEVGIDRVMLHLYRDVNHNGMAESSEYFGQTTSATAGGFSGRYRFVNLPAGDYIVVVAQSNFEHGGALAGMISSTGNDPAPDPDDDVNGDDNGTAVGAVVQSRPITLTVGGEPTSEDGDANTNLTLDFGFKIDTTSATTYFDYGDAPDFGFVGPGSYNTSALNNGPAHRLGVTNAPWLGDCVDADNGGLANVAADADDSQIGSFTAGTCAQAGHDEDGVTIASPLVPGTAASISIRVGSASSCVVNAWIDFDGDGIFGDSAGEQIASDLNVAPGTPTTLSPVVPANAKAGLSYARFRCASVGGLAPTGLAPDGEVEDYRVSIAGSDFGDAPASYGTQGAGAASHLVSGANPLRLGTCIDLEADGQPSADADGDDLAAGTNAQFGLCFDDEDGVQFSAPLVACEMSSLSVVSSGAGKLDAWIDYNHDGDFSDAGEKIFASMALTAGSNPLTFTVPCAALGGGTYARFRLSSAGGLGPTGAAADGEVEDYAVGIAVNDFGDAPASYGTLIADNGARHVVVNGFSLGASEDGEGDGQPGPNADGDGADEDGVTISGPLNACSASTLSVSLVNTAALPNAKLDAWIDFDRDGQFDDPRDRIAAGVALIAGANTLNVNVPCDAKAGISYARFRLSSAGIATPIGPSADGEVEDYKVQIQSLDFGDAPDSYGTLLASNGARHLIDPAATLRLGTCVDSEPDAAPNTAANGDDTAAGTTTVGSCAQAGDDEDGIVFTSLAQACGTATVDVSASAPGKLDGWVDFDNNGQFDSADRIFASTALIAGSNSLTFAVPCNAVAGSSYARFRVSTAGGLAATGLAQDGEVEDYALMITALLPQLGLAKHVVGVVQDTVNHSKFHLSFEFAAVNSGNAALGTVQITDDLVSTFAGAISFQVVGVSATGGLLANSGFNGSGDKNLLGTGSTLAIGASGMVAVDVDIVVEAQRSFFNSATTTATAPGNTPLSDVSQDGTDPDPDHNGNPGDNSEPTPIVLPVFAPQLGLAKRLLSATQDTTDSSKFHLSFAFIANNSGNADLLGVQIADDLASVFASATSFAVTGVSASGSLIANPGFNGATDKNLLASGSTLASGVTGGVDLNVDIVVDAVRTFDNTASATGMTQGGTPVSDVSQDGADPDPDHNGNPGDNSDPTPIVLPALAPQLGLAKRLLSATQDTIDPAKFHLSFAFIANNSGNADLFNVQTIDDLASVFASATSFAVTGVSTSGSLIANPGFNGTADKNLLATGSTLASGASGGVDLNVDIVVDVVRTFDNTASATSLTIGGTPLSDVSQDGVDPDPDHNGNPGDNSDPTPVVLPQYLPEIGIAKALTGITASATGANTYTLGFAFTVVNPGNVNLTNVQIVDDLASVFAGPVAFHVTSVAASGTLIANAGFNGTADKNLLAAGSTLGVGVSATVTLTVEITVTTLRSFNNSATASGQPSSGPPVTDTSENG